VDLHRLFDDVIRFEMEIWEAVDRRLRAEHSLPLSWFEPMRAIDRIENCRASDIATELSITEGGTSKLVARIEAAGYCERTPNPDDRRASFITLTPAGEDMLTIATQTFGRELEPWFQSVSADDLQHFATTLATLRVRKPIPTTGVTP